MWRVVSLGAVNGYLQSTAHCICPGQYLGSLAMRAPCACRLLILYRVGIVALFFPTNLGERNQPASVLPTRQLRWQPAEGKHGWPTRRLPEERSQPCRPCRMEGRGPTGIQCESSRYMCHIRSSRLPLPLNCGVRIPQLPTPRFPSDHLPRAVPDCSRPSFTSPCLPAAPRPVNLPSTLRSYLPSHHTLSHVSDSLAR